MHSLDGRQFGNYSPKCVQIQDPQRMAFERIWVADLQTRSRPIRAATFRMAPHESGQ